MIDGWFAAAATSASETEAAFSEDVLGLQGQSDSFSTGLTPHDGTARTVFVLDPLISLGSGLDALSDAHPVHDARQSGPTDELEISRRPARGPVRDRAVDLVFESSYFSER